MKINFINEPKLSDSGSQNTVQNDFDEKRLKLIPAIKQFISNHPRFKDHYLDVTFFDKGVSSLVALIENQTEKVVLKIPLSLTHSNGTGMFLRKWAELEVRVPKVFDDGMIGEHTYTLMEYIDAPTISQYSHDELITKGIYLEMGRVLRLMHKAKGEGFGLFVNGRGDHDSFESWLNGEDMNERMAYIKTHSLLGEADKFLSQVLAILIDYIGDAKESSYCHDDFSGGNIFATNPITVFDPNPRFNHGYIDLGKSLVNHIAVGLFPEQLIEGYFGGENYDKKFLYSSIFLNMVIKLPYQHKKGPAGVEIIKNFQNYLLENSKLL